MADRVRRWQLVTRWPSGKTSHAFFDSEDQANAVAVGASMECAMRGYEGVSFDVCNPAGEVVASFEIEDDAGIEEKGGVLQ